jgi:hypothetical protein
MIDLAATKKLTPSCYGRVALHSVLQAASRQSSLAFAAGPEAAKSAAHLSAAASGEVASSWAALSRHASNAWSAHRHVLSS